LRVPPIGDEDADVTYNGGASSEVPFQCSFCHRTAWTRRRNPHCEGLRNGKRHERAAMKRVDVREKPARDDLFLS
jgi:hypothetical protein